MDAMSRFTRNHQEGVVDDDDKNFPSSSKKSYFEKLDKIGEEDKVWCVRTNDWTKKLSDSIGLVHQNPKARAFETCLQLFRCAIKEVAKVKDEYVKFSAEVLKDPAIEENIKDYRECVLPKLPNPTYTNHSKNTVQYCYNYAFYWGQPYRSYLAQVLKTGCKYRTALKKQVEVAYALSLDILCLLYRAQVSTNIKPLPPFNLVLPDYISSNTGNTIMFIRDFLVIRDFYDYCKKMALMFGFRMRKYAVDGQTFGE